MSTDQGCFREGREGRALDSLSFTMDNMTNDACKSLCSGYRYYGTEYGSECYCGTRLDNGPEQVPNSACDAPCAGDSQQICGGASLLSIRKNTFNFTTHPPLFNYTYLGCAREPDSSRALEDLISVGLLTRNKCLIICSSGGYGFAGMEYGNECWCGHTLGAIGFNGTCNMPCAGNSSDTCGGSLSLDLYMRVPFNATTSPGMPRRL